MVRRFLFASDVALRKHSGANHFVIETHQPLHSFHSHNPSQSGNPTKRFLLHFSDFQQPQSARTVDATDRRPIIGLDETCRSLTQTRTGRLIH